MKKAAKKKTKTAKKRAVNLMIHRATRGGYET